MQEPPEIKHMFKTLPSQPPESFGGNKEYKWKWPLASHTEKTLHKLATQLLYRLVEGSGKAVYIIGVLDNGVPLGIDQTELDLSLEFMRNIVAILNASIYAIRIYNGISGYIATIRICLDISQFDLVL